MDQLMAALMSEISALREFLDIPGMSIRVVQHGRSVLQEDLGWQDINAHRSMESQAIFPLASLTKLITSVAMYRMQELGKIKLYDHVPVYLQDKVSKGTQLVQLLTHTSNLADGSMFLYDGGRFGLLKKVIEHEMDMELPQALVELVFSPAGIEEVYFLRDQADVEALAERLVTLYYPESGHTVCKYEVGLTGASGLSMTVDTFVQFEQALFAGKIIASETCEDLIQPAVRPNGNLHSTGKGLFVQSVDESPVIWSFGQEDGLGHLYLRFPQYDCSIFILSNSPQLTDPARLIYGDIRSSLFFEPCFAYVEQRPITTPFYELQRIAKKEVKITQQPDEKLSGRLFPFLLAKTYQLGHDTTGLMEVKRILQVDALTEFDQLALLHLIDAISDPDKVETEWELVISTVGKKLLLQEPMNPYIRYYLARQCLRLQLFEEAKEHFETIDQYFGGAQRWYWVEACFELGSLYLKVAPDQARSCFNKIVTLNWNYCGLVERSKQLLESLETE